MKKDIKNLTDKAKKLTATNLPFSSDELRSRIENSKSSELQDKFKNLFNKKWGKKMIAVGSILAGASIALLVFSNQTVQTGAKNKNTQNSKNKQQFVTNFKSPTSLISDYSISDSSFQKAKNISEEKRVGDSILKSYDEKSPNFTYKKSFDFEWYEIEYDQIINEFIGKQFFTVYNKENKLTRTNVNRVKIEFQDLIKIYDLLSSKLYSYDYFRMKDIGYYQDKDFYINLENTIKEIKQKNISDDTQNIFELYALISHKLSNLSSSINYLSLSFSELENLGIFVTDSSISFQTEIFYEKFPKYWDIQMIKHNYPEDNDKPILAKFKNIIFWQINREVTNNNSRFSYGFEKEISDIVPQNDTSKIIGCRAKYLIDYSGWKIDDYNPKCPVYSDFLGNVSHLENSPILYFGSGSLNEYFNLLKIYSQVHFSWSRVGLDNKVKDSLSREDEKVTKNLKRMQYSLLANTLLPVKLIIPDTNNPKFKGLSCSSYLFLFVPTEAFLNSLPIRYSVPLRKEIDAIKKYENGELPYYDACKGLESQETFFDLCKMESAYIKEVKTYPNPAKSTAKLDFILLQDRFTNITIHDINGKFIREIKAWGKSSQNKYSIDINLKDIEPGLYLITILTDKAEKVVQRLIVE